MDEGAPIKKFEIPLQSCGLIHFNSTPINLFKMFEAISGVSPSKK
jgi:hypothetical protein